MTLKVAAPKPPSRQELDDAVVAAYCAANDVKPAKAREAFGTPGGLEFDSLIGLELMAALEAKFGVEIPAREGTRRQNFATLRTFADMVERYVGSGRSARASRTDAPAARR